MIMGRKYKSYSYEEYMKAMELLERGYSLRETCRLLGWPEKKNSLLYFWKHGKHKPPLVKWRAEPSKELAYVVGVVQGDGCVCKNEADYEYLIQLDTIDQEFAIIFSKVISRLLSVKYHKPRWDKKERVWIIRYRSKPFYEWYKRCEKQGLQGFKSFIEYNRETVKYYLRGLYDSEGNNCGNKEIRLYNTKKKLLEYIQYLLERYFGIVTAGPYLQRKAGTKTVINGVKTTTKYDCYRIVIGRKEHVQKYLEEIGFTIIRKQLGLRKHEKQYVEGIGM